MELGFDDEEYMNEFNAYQRVEIFTGSNVYISNLYRQKTRELALKIAEAVMFAISEVLVTLNTGVTDRSNYIGDLQYVNALQYRSPVGLYCGWLAKMKGIDVVLQAINGVKDRQWPTNIEKPRDVDVLRYMRFWDITTPSK